MRHIWEAFLNGELFALGSAIAGGIGAAGDALKEKFNEATGYDSVEEWFDDLVDDILPDASTYQRSADKLKELWENFLEFGENVVSDIGDAVGDALGSGEISEQTDGGLGETSDIFAPEGEGPQVEIGELPGFGTPETGMNRDEGGGGGTSPDYGGGGGGGGGGTTPLGGGGETGGAPEPTSPPTAEDLGLPEGSYVEYQPGQVVITYPDGTQETRPWP